MPCDYDQLPHPGIRTLAPYVPGKSADELTRERGLTDIIKLAGNENPLGCSPLVKLVLADLSGKQIAAYPMSVNHPLRHKLAEKLGVDTDMITIGNGSDSLFCSLLTCFALHNGKHILTHDYAFSSYAIQAKTLGIPVVSMAVKPNWEVDIDALIDACDLNTALIFIANPNNPTGLMICQEDIIRLLDNIPETTIMVLDEAYFEYAFEVLHPATCSRDPEILHKSSGSREQIAGGRNAELLKKYPHLVITRTFSKAYGLAGIRLGYAIANTQITALLYRIQLPFVVNITALTAGYAALDDDDFIRQTIQLNNQGLIQMQLGLTALGLTHLPSAGNFITFDCGEDSLGIYQRLQDYGIIVRPLHPYGLNQHLRVTIGTQDQNTRFIDTLSKELHHEK